MSGSFTHDPVLVGRIVELLAPAATDGGIVIDATVGLGGHSEALLASFPTITVVGVDRDPEALALASARLAGYGDRFVPFSSVFDDISGAVAAAGGNDAAAVLFDLGVSSLQLDSDARGFAYSRSTRLDMRMDPRSGVTAEDVVNDYSPGELEQVFALYGEERFARRIAHRIATERQQRRITTTDQLSAICDAAIPAAARRKGHPAKRVFQGLRIEVNGELDALRLGLEHSVRTLRPNGRVAVLSYHSLEDRIVKRAFAAGARPPVPAGLPVIPDDARPFLRLLTRGAEQASDSEVRDNPRAASVRLRAVQRILPIPPTWTVAA